MNGYLLKGSRDEFLLVIRHEDIDVLRSIVHRLGKMRESEIQNVVKELEFSLERIDSERS